MCIKDICPHNPRLSFQHLHQQVKDQKNCRRMPGTGLWSCSRSLARSLVRRRPALVRLMETLVWIPGQDVVRDQPGPTREETANDLEAVGTTVTYAVMCSDPFKNAIPIIKHGGGNVMVGAVRLLMKKDDFRTLRGFRAKRPLCLPSRLSPSSTQSQISLKLICNL